MKPAQRRVGRRHAKRLFVEHRDRAVVDLLAVGVAPGRVEHLTDFGLGHVSGDDVVEQPAGVAARDEILIERRHVEQRGRVADRVVFAVVGELVGARDDIPGPAPPGLPLRQWRRAGMKRRGAETHVAIGVSAGAKMTRTCSSAVMEWKWCSTPAGTKIAAPGAIGLSSAPTRIVARPPTT